MQTLNEKWKTILDDIPSPDATTDHFWKIYAGDRMDKYGEFVLIDKIAKHYSYTHEQVFNLSWREAYTIIALNREQAYIEHKATEAKRESEKK